MPADIIRVDGNPLDDAKLLGDSGKNIPFIMKDGKSYKNTLRCIRPRATPASWATAAMVASA